MRMKKLFLLLLTFVSAMVAKAEVQQISVAQFLELKDTETVYQLRGVVSNITNTLYGNFDLVDETGSVYIYGLLNSEGTAKQFQYMDILAGDTLTLQGAYFEYQGNPEIKNAQYISHVHPSEQPGQPEVQEISVEEFLSRADTQTTYQLRGIVSNITNTTYGNFDLVDGNSSILIYGLVLLDGTAKQFASLGIQEGDSIVVRGSYTLYGETPEVKNAVYVSHTSNGGGQEPEDPELTPDTPINGNYVVNGNFETWADGLPSNWKSTTTASNATLTQSTDSHSGQYSVNIASTDANKRLAYKELVLAAGTYTFAFYAKGGEGNENPEARPGYAPLKDDGSMGNYSYSDYVKLSSDWTLVSYTFTLAATTKLNLVVMNPKNTGNILVDDASLVAGDQPLVIQGIRTESKLDLSKAVIFDICGKRVSDMSRKGIYIVNGKKYIVK